MMYCNINGGNTQCHLVGVRGYGIMYCNINDGNMRHHFVGIRGYGHDESAPTPTEWTWQNVGYNK
ncbi:hypothetical protein [Prevotella pallens]